MTDSLAVERASARDIGAEPREEAPALERWLPLERATLAAFLFFVSLLTLEWMTVGGVLGGVLKPFHFGATLLLGVIAARYSLRDLVVPIMRRYGTIFIAFMVFLLLAILLARFHPRPYANTKDIIRQTTYSFTGLVVAGYFARYAGRARARRWLMWAGVVSCLVLTLGMLDSLKGSGASPVSTVKEALQKSDPDIIAQQLLKTAFESNTDFEEAKVNLRHKVASALFLGLLIALAFKPKMSWRSPWRMALFWGTIAYGFAAIVFTFSRSITSALAVVLALNGLRFLISGRAKPAHMAAITITAVVTVAALASPVGDLVYSRFFEQTDSYSGRVTAVGLFLDEAATATWTGADLGSITAPPHNAVMDSWFTAGILGFLLVVLTVGSLILVLVYELRRYLLSLPGWVLPINHFWVVAMGVTPIVRIFTAANGLHLTEWTSVGVFIGCVEANQRRLRANREAATVIDTEGGVRGFNRPVDQPAGA